MSYPKDNVTLVAVQLKLPCQKQDDMPTRVSSDEYMLWVDYGEQMRLDVCCPLCQEEHHLIINEDI